MGGLLHFFEFNQGRMAKKVLARKRHHGGMKTFTHAKTHYKKDRLCTNFLLFIPASGRLPIDNSPVKFVFYNIRNVIDMMKQLESHI